MFRRSPSHVRGRWPAKHNPRRSSLRSWLHGLQPPLAAHNYPAPTSFCTKFRKKSYWKIDKVLNEKKKQSLKKKTVPTAKLAAKLALERSWHHAGCTFTIDEERVSRSFQSFPNLSMVKTLRLLSSEQRSIQRSIQGSIQRSFHGVTLKLREELPAKANCRCGHHAIVTGSDTYTGYSFAWLRRFRSRVGCA